MNGMSFMIDEGFGSSVCVQVWEDTVPASFLSLLYYVVEVHVREVHERTATWQQCETPD